ncbi:MAG: SUMF1/EgtB/PvdO family nonheme iron enzyme [Mangrovibacterium sp.]
MKQRLLYYILVLFACASCVGKSSNLANSIFDSGASPFYEQIPYGMSYVPRGSFTLGSNDEVAQSHTPQKRVSIEAFWMDETEITNNEYRQYVYWVRDSIFRKAIGEQIPGYLITEEKKTKEPLDNPRIDWSVKINMKDKDVQMALEDYFFSDDSRVGFRKSLDIHQLIYTYEYVDYSQAAKKTNSYNYDKDAYEGELLDPKGKKVKINKRSDFMFRETSPVYPDTLVWVRDYTYSYNEPMMRAYFWHPSFDNYPVVGVTWLQATAFCHWRTRFFNDYQTANKGVENHDYRLPTEAEWEYAARAGKTRTLYPWGSYYVGTQIGCYMANFKPRRGNYVADSRWGATTVPVASYGANDYRLFDMAGNVAEWTSTAFDESSYEFMSDFNPQYQYNALPNDPPVLKRKVIRGGSWKDVSYFIRNGTRTFEYQDTATCAIGFRCVKTSFMNEFNELRIKKN